MDLFHIEEREEVGHGCSHYAAHSTYNYLLHLQRSQLEAVPLRYGMQMEAVPLQYGMQLEAVPLRHGTQMEAVPLQHGTQLQRSEDTGNSRHSAENYLNHLNRMQLEAVPLRPGTQTEQHEDAGEINQLHTDKDHSDRHGPPQPNTWKGEVKENSTTEEYSAAPTKNSTTEDYSATLTENSTTEDYSAAPTENSTTEDYSAAPAPYPDDPARLPNAQPLLATTQDPIPGLDPVQSPTVCAPTPAPPKPGPSTGNPARPPPLSVPHPAPPDPGPGLVYFLRPRPLRVPPPVPPDPGPSSNNFARSPPSRAPPPVPSDPGPSPNNSVRPPPSRAPPPVPPDPGPSPNDTDYFQRPPPVHLPPPAPPDEGILYFFSSEEREEGTPDFINTSPGPPTLPEDLTQAPVQLGNTEPYYDGIFSPVPMKTTGLQPPRHTTSLQPPLHATGLQQPSSVPLCTTGLQQPPPMPLAMHTTHAHTGLPPPLIGSYFDPGPSTLQRPTPTAPANCAPALLTSYAPALTFCALALTSCAPALTFCAYGTMNSALQGCATTAKLDHHYLNHALIS